VTVLFALFALNGFAVVEIFPCDPA